MAMFREQAEASERLRREEREHAERVQQEARERIERAQREERERAERAQQEELERAERARQEERERDRAYQRELLSLVCSLVKGPSGSGLLEAARQEVSCSGEVGARVDRLLQPTVVDYSYERALE